MIDDRREKFMLEMRCAMNEYPLYQITRKTVAPVLYLYVEWVLKNAQQRGISTLYFLARDGYALEKIARRICEKRKWNIECRYLYCSRASLRTPSYHLIGQEALELLFFNSFRVNLNSFFERAGISEPLRDEILKEMGLENEDIFSLLNPAQVNGYKEMFAANERYCSYISEYSKAFYEDAVGYFRQEGLFEQEVVAVVDSGWSGSMQRSLRQLLGSAGYTGSFVGYYFGMYAYPHSGEDGEYCTWFFDKKQKYWNHLFFNNNLFECMLSAPHGMTQYYVRQDEKYVPVLGEEPSGSMTEAIEMQLQGIMDAAEDYLAVEMPQGSYERAACARLRKLMVLPRREEAEAYRDFLFCDDIDESSYYRLADPRWLDSIGEYTLWRRVCRKLTGNAKPDGHRQYWIYGALAYIGSPIKREWYRLNIWLWELMRFVLKRI